MSATARTNIYVSYTDDDEERTARAMIQVYMKQVEIAGYTVYSAEGWWNGTKEQAIVIEIIGDSGDLDFSISEVAHRLRHNELLTQEAVYVVTELVDLVVY